MMFSKIIILTILIAAVTLTSCNSSNSNKDPTDKILADTFQGKWGYINSDGQIVIEPQFNNAGYFHNGIAKVSFRNKDGFIDKTGQLLFGRKFDSARDFSDGLAPVQIEGKWGYINNKGEVAINPQFEGAESFHEGWLM